MSKATNIILAIVVFLLAWLLCTLTVSGPDTSSYAWAIGLVIALVLGVGAYYLFDALQKYSFAQQEKTAKEIFAPVLPAGEMLLAFVKGYTGPGRTGMVLLFGALGDALINAPRRKWYYAGVTKQYLVLVQVNGKKPTGVQQVLRRSEVGQLVFESGAFKEPKLILQFAAERMELRIDANMIKRAKEIDATWRNVA
jgi:hypothetical protein